MPCAFCRAPLPQGARFCDECGQPQPAAPNAPSAVQHAPAPPPQYSPPPQFKPAPQLQASPQFQPPQFQPPSPQPSAADRKKQLAGTMIGVAAPQVARPPEPAPAPPADPGERKKQFAGTMIGVASPHLQAPPAPASPERAFPQAVAPQQAFPQPAFPEPARHHAPQPGPQPGAPKNKFAGTMIGVAVPGVAPTHAGEGPVAPPKNKGTIMGVAIPGVAPTHAHTPQFQPPQPPPPYQPQHQHPHQQAHGQYQQPAQQQTAWAPQLAPPPAFVPPTANQSEDEEPELSVRKPSRAPVIALLVLALLGIAGALVFVLRPSGPPPLSSSIEGDSTAPRLVITCATCEDGSTIDLGSKNATFDDGKATIAITPKDLKAGKNVFSGKVVPKGKKPQDVELEVAIPYLVHPSLAPLGKGEDHVDLVFELAPDAKGVEVDGETIEGTGKQTVAITIPPAADDAKTFEKTVTYRVLQKTGKPIAGTLKLAIPYATLRIGLPGRRPFVIGDELEVTGHTAAGASVVVGEDAPITADDKGTFKTKTKVGKATSLKIRAFAAKLAPRETTIALTAAASVDEITKLLRAEAKATTFEAIAAKPDAYAGKAVDLKLSVEQTAEEDGRAVAVGDVRCPAAAAGGACPVVRVLLPMGATVAKGDVIEVLGIVVRGLSIEGGKTTAVEIDGSVVLRQN